MWTLGVMHKEELSICDTIFQKFYICWTPALRSFITSIYNNYRDLLNINLNGYPAWVLGQTPESPDIQPGQMINVMLIRKLYI